MGSTPYTSVFRHHFPQDSFPSIDSPIGIVWDIDNISCAIIELLHMKHPDQCQWKNICFIRYYPGHHAHAEDF